MRHAVLTIFAMLWLANGVTAETLSREQVMAKLTRYSGPAVTGVDRKTLTGKVMTGYQGWFSTAGDGAGRGWQHYGIRGGFEPGKVAIEMWPDVSELDPDEKYDTPFRHIDGKVAQVFSSYNRKTVLRHFKWMQDYGVDGAFVQRFVVQLESPAGLNHVNTVLASCREGANTHGRSYCVMYDLSGMKAGGQQRVIDDWRSLVDRMAITKDPADKAYQHHDGKPVVAIWGIGFNDKRAYSLDDCRKLIEFFNNDPVYGGNTVMLGVPAYWRTLDRDALADSTLHDLIQSADIVSPWTVGRYNSPDGARDFARKHIVPDLNWCQDHRKAYLPVIFPGFSWSNLKPGSAFNSIPRLGGQFLWTQAIEARKAGATMLYVAMFDEMDEATAIFKTSSDVPVGPSKFVTHDGLPSDFYLRLTGHIAKMLRGDVPMEPEVPTFK